MAIVEALRMRDGWTGASLMPAVVGSTLVLLGLAHPRVPATETQWPDVVGARRVVATLVLLALYVACMPSLGFLLATALFPIPLVRGLGGWSWPLTLGTAAAIAVASHLVFKHWLGMPLPPGPLGL